MQTWELKSSEMLLETGYFSVKSDRVITHTGAEITYTYIDHPGAAIVVPVTRNGEIVMLYQYRHPVGEWCWEVPAGGMYMGARAIDTARAELSEEIGAVVADLEEVGSFYLSNGSSNQKGHVYISWGAEPGDTRHEDTEMMEVRVVALEEAMRMARDGEIADGPSALALLICESRIRSRLNQSGGD